MPTFFFFFFFLKGQVSFNWKVRNLALRTKTYQKWNDPEPSVCVPQMFPSQTTQAMVLLPAEWKPLMMLPSDPNEFSLQDFLFWWHYQKKLLCTITCGQWRLTGVPSLSSTKLHVIPWDRKVLPRLDPFKFPSPLPTRLLQFQCCVPLSHAFGECTCCCGCYSWVPWVPVGGPPCGSLGWRISHGITPPAPSWLAGLASGSTEEACGSASWEGWRDAVQWELVFALVLVLLPAPPVCQTPCDGSGLDPGIWAEQGTGGCRAFWSPSLPCAAHNAQCQHGRIFGWVLLLCGVAGTGSLVPALCLCGLWRSSHV